MSRAVVSSEHGRDESSYYKYYYKLSYDACGWHRVDMIMVPCPRDNRMLPSDGWSYRWPINDHNEGHERSWFSLSVLLVDKQHLVEVAAPWKFLKTLSGKRGKSPLPSPCGTRSWSVLNPSNRLIVLFATQQLGLSVTTTAVRSARAQHTRCRPKRYFSIPLDVTTWTAARARVRDDSLSFSPFHRIIIYFYFFQMFSLSLFLYLCFSPENNTIF